MKRMMVYIKRFFSLHLNPPAMTTSSVSGFKPIPHIHYIPAPDEPSLFGNGPDGINRGWLSWYLKNNTSKGYVAAIATGNQIKIGLSSEPPRSYNPRYLPAILIGSSKQISLEWVIWYHYEFDVELETAHQIAVSITGRE